MGIEQILMPLLGGVAAGASTGILYKAKQRDAEQEAQRNRVLKLASEQPSLMEIPDFNKMVTKAVGGNKEDAAIWAASARAKAAYDLNQEQQMLQGVVSTGQTINDFYTSPPAAPLGAAAPGGGLGGILASLFGGGQAPAPPPGGGQAAPPPGMAVQDLGGTYGQTPVVPPQAPAPGSNADIVRALQAKGIDARDAGGAAPRGRPIVQNPDGSVSSHRNIIVGFDNKFYLVPTLYGGKEVSPDQAIAIARQNNLTDPDTGQPLPAFGSQEEAARGEQVLHAQMERQARPTAAAQAFTPAPAVPQGPGMRPRGKVLRITDLPKGTKWSQKIGKGTLTLVNQTPEAQKGLRGVLFRIRYPDQTTPATPEQELQILQDEEDLAVNKALRIVRGEQEIKLSPGAVRRRADEAQLTEILKSQARTEHQLGQPYQQAQHQTSASRAQGTEIGKALGQVSDIYGGGGVPGPQPGGGGGPGPAYTPGQTVPVQMPVQMPGAVSGGSPLAPGSPRTPMEVEAARTRILEKIRNAENPLDATAAQALGVREEIVNSLQDVRKYTNKGKYLGIWKGWTSGVRSKMPTNVPLAEAFGLGPMGGEEGKFRQSIQNAKQANTRMLSGLAVPLHEAEAISETMPDGTEGTLDLFDAKMELAIERGVRAVERWGNLVRYGRGETIGQGQGAPTGGAAPAAAPGPARAPAYLDRSAFVGGKLPSPQEMADPVAFKRLLTPEMRAVLKQKMLSGELSPETTFLATETPPVMEGPVEELR